MYARVLSYDEVAAAMPYDPADTRDLTIAQGDLARVLIGHTPTPRGLQTVYFYGIVEWVSTARVSLVNRKSRIRNVFDRDTVELVLTRAALDAPRPTQSAAHAQSSAQ